ncbi:bifunctional ADP-dependent NAD(P)H-hydrate dehydratase/NAD(P)H-hydrate epimerase [Pseudonocardia acaciae]|uniref:bifunctional ADP-dependent NAD(P)H-hydrate dehydratase/NAD(P)H-hydrate epimerase n=1 Tax=Pseudonocardia acaciae TaxID=551276 RepID=UPI00048FF90A|nr:bifunctional ADP-dependent NAD(P)H-hydrate dehydratase/NAD(P)H-hydrate epimerase [Pseudonocardia acaciae]
MRRMWTAEHVRVAESALMARVPEGALMRRAAYGVSVRAAELLRERAGGVAGRRVTLLVGAGNNGGDALWAGYELRRRGAGVTAVLLSPERAHPAGLGALRRVGGRVVSGGGDGAVRDADLVIDGIVGISGRGALREPAAALCAAACGAGVPILAVDLPSGVDPDTGTVDGPSVTAAATVTFGAYKPVHALAPHACGPVRLVDIGLGPYLPADADLHALDASDVGARWPVPGPADDKYTQGVVGIAAGSTTYPGAAVLSAGAAVAATSGMVRFAGGAADEVRSRWPEVVAAGSVADSGRAQAWTVGPGIGTGSAGRDTLAAVLDQGVPVCLDADAITLLANTPNLADAAAELPAVYTPHDREFARLAGDVGPDRVAAARRAASSLGATVLLKGHVTVVADPDGRALANPAGGSWAATAGSGDVLSGLIGALLAAGLEPWWAAGCAAYLHAHAASLAATGRHRHTDRTPGAPIGASGLLAAVPEAIRRVRAAARAV